MMEFSSSQRKRQKQKPEQEQAKKLNYYLEKSTYSVLILPSIVYMTFTVLFDIPFIDLYSKYHRENHGGILSIMLENLEYASTNPINCVEYISTVAGLAAELISKSEKEWRQIFHSQNQRVLIEIVSFATVRNMSDLCIE